MAAAEAGADGVAAHAKLVLVALLGAGQFAQKSQAPALLKLSSPRVRIAAVYSRSEDRARQLAGWVAEQPAEGGSCREGDPQGAPVPDVYWDEGGPDRSLDALLARPDVQACVMSLPICVQPQAVLRCLRAGKAVLSEKPIAGSLAEARELVAGYAALGSGRPLWGVAENYRLEPGMVRLAQACRELGAVHSLRFTAHQVVAPWNDTPWRLAPEYDGGYLLDAGVHFVAAMRLVLGDVDLSTVRATVQRRREVLAGPDQFAASFAFRSGALGMLEVIYAAPRMRVEVEALGDSGWLLLARTSRGGAHGYELTGGSGGEPRPAEFFPFGGVPRALSGFLLAAVGHGEPRAELQPEEALADVELVDAVLRAAGWPDRGRGCGGGGKL